MVYALLIFAVVFFVVGVLRIVEFKAAGISEGVRWILIPLHVLGCAAFSGSIALLALGMDQTHRTWMTGLFFSAVFLLFPIQIYVGIKRRIQSKSEPSPK